MSRRNLVTVIRMLIVVIALNNIMAQTDQGVGTVGVRYRVINLGALGGTFSSAFGINNRSWVTGAANVEGDQTEHAVLWRNGLTTDLGTLGGPNGSAGFPFKNDRGLIAGIGQTSAPDPLGENWNFSCSLSGNLCEGTNLIVGGFLWVGGVKTAMPTLGGNNGSAFGVNNRGQVVGIAETDIVDANCLAPQVLDAKAVIWNPSLDQIKELPAFAGDSVSAAIGINDYGQAVGASGICAPVSPALAVHALLWQNGTAIDLGNLGGSMSNVAYAINNQGQVVGVSDLPGDTTAHAFFWQNGKITDLGTLPGDVFSAAFSINNKGQIVGESCDVNFNCRAFLWQNGTMADLNTFTFADSSLYLLSANDVNDLGEIVGQAFDQISTSAPAFLAAPTSSEREAPRVLDRIILPEKVREQLRKQRGFRPFPVGPIRPE
jgi:probable HAF family extracellular repeat protein